jgi:YidC/Oxa1 family membrane protein insertase
MDRQAALGYILIFILLVVWMWMTAPPPAQEPQTPPQQTTAQDTVGARPVVQPPQERITAPSPESRYFTKSLRGQDRSLFIETDLYVAEITAKGGLIKTWELKKFKTWDGHPVQLVEYEGNGDLSLLFTTTDGRVINTKDLYFDPGPGMYGRKVLAGDDSLTLDLTLTADNGGKIVKRMTFKNGVYDFDTELVFENMGEVIANFEYQVVWEHGLRYAERNSVDESAFAYAYAYAGKELIEIDAHSFGERPTKNLSGVVDWVATRNKYFTVALIPIVGTSEGAYLEGRRRPMPDKGVIEHYSVALKMPFKGMPRETALIKVFLGPADLDLLRSYEKGLENIVSLGWVWLIRPISEYLILPLMSFLFYIIPNWGLVIIVFSVVIKIALHPLTKSSMKSMKKMQALQPMMEEIRQKYKDDPQKMNQQIMNLYKEYGVNPAGGCLPLLLQFPILFALYVVFTGAIELRQAEFFWWITDLSIPDKIFSLPFEVPLFGVKDVSGLALLMGITMFIQQKMTIKDPRQKMLVWLMPILMTLLFNGFPSGLNLYYFVFNLLSIGQQALINRQADKEPLRKVEPKKRKQGGIFGKLPDDFRKFKR